MSRPRLDLSFLSHLHTFDALIAYPNYRFLWMGNFCANSAQWMQLLTVGWLVRDLTDGSTASALLVVTVGGLNTLPGLIFTPWGGVLGDRLDRRKMIMGFQIFMAALAFCFALLVLSGKVQVWHAFAYVMLSGASFSVTQPMRQAIIANTVAREMVGNAFAINVLTITGTRAIGPFIGGILIASLGFFWNFTVEAALYLGMVLFYLPMKTPFTRIRPVGEKQAGMTALLIEGVGYIWKGNRSIFNLVVLGMIPNVILQPFLFLLPVFTVEVLGKGADVGGYLLATTGLGGLVCGLLLASIGFPIRKGLLVLATAICSSVFVIVLSVSTSLALALIVVAIIAFSQCVYRTANGTLIQTLVPDELRGRVSSLQNYGRGFLVPASLATGWIAGATSVQTALVVIGAVGLVLSVYCMFTFRRLRALP